MSYCKKCGISVNNMNADKHNDNCTFVPSDDTYVEDLEVEPYWKLSGGYGFWELALIYDIMVKLYGSKKYSSSAYSTELFYEAEKIYKYDTGREDTEVREES